MGDSSWWRRHGHNRPTRRRAIALTGARALAVGLAVNGLVATGSGISVAAPNAAVAGSAARTSLRLAVPSAASTGWPAYLFGLRHTSYNPSQTAISPASARRLRRQWLLTRGAPYIASPTVAGGSVFIGSATGWLYKLSQATGSVQARTFIGRERSITCPGNGIVSTAAVARNPNGVLTVYVTGGGYLYALRAFNLRREWRGLIGRPSARVNSYDDWSSPTIAHGKVYVGIASTCDRPLVRGGILAFSQRDGRRVARYFTVPAGASNAGGTVWSTIGIGPDGDVYATTGNGPARRPRLDHAESILRLSPSLRLLGAFKVPARQVVRDGDFGGSPVFFGAMVGACNKNGIFYALNRATMRLVWWKRIADEAGPDSACLAAPADNGTDLFFGGSATSIRGRSFPGSVQARLPRTGVLQWITGLSGPVLGSPALDGAGVLSAVTFAGASPGVYLIASSTGAVLRRTATARAFGQAVFASGKLFCATFRGVSAWRLR